MILRFTKNQSKEQIANSKDFKAQYSLFIALRLKGVLPC